MYQIRRSMDEEVIRWDDNGIIRWIPMVEGNRHYQEYLAWVAEGNTALVIEADA